jgi:hypothetical protein
MRNSRIHGDQSSAKLVSKKWIRLQFVPLLILYSLLASGCASTEQTAIETENAKLIKTCAKIKGSLRKTTKHFDENGLFRELQFGDTDSNMSLLSGVEERNNWEKLILREYPYLNSIEGGRNYEGSGMGAVFLLLDSIAGTQFERSLSASELVGLQKAIQTELYNSSGSVSTSRWSVPEFKNLYTSTIGSFSSSDQPSGCANVDEWYDTSRVFGEAIDVIATLEETLWAIRTCRLPGDKWTLETPNDSNNCARESYEPKDEDFGPIVLDNPWEKDWTDKWSEQTAKFAYCWDRQMIYSESSDACVD